MIENRWSRHELASHTTMSLWRAKRSPLMGYGVHTTETKSVLPPTEIFISLRYLHLSCHRKRGNEKIQIQTRYGGIRLSCAPICENYDRVWNSWTSNNIFYETVKWKVTSVRTRRWYLDKSLRGIRFGPDRILNANFPQENKSRPYKWAGFFTEMMGSPLDGTRLRRSVASHQV